MLVGDLERWEEKIHAALSYHSGLEEIYTEQRDLFLRKVQADFEAIQRLLDRKKTEMIYQISNAYKDYIDSAASAKAGLAALRDNLDRVKGAQIKLDIE